MNTTSYTYSADGTKLRAVYHTNLLSSSEKEVDEGGYGAAEKYDHAEDDKENEYFFSTKTIDYVGNLMYEDGMLKQLFVDGGYVTFAGNIPTGTPTYHFYLKDHLGNIRVVVSESGSVEQVNHYYPYGGLMAECTGMKVQRYKYNGKEFDRMHGLGWNDHGARQYNPVTGQWDRMDPFCEKYYHLSPYAQDVIVKRDGNTILAKVTMVGDKEIEYKKYNSSSDRLYSVSTSDVITLYW